MLLLIFLACAEENMEETKEWEKWTKEEPALLVTTDEVALGNVANHLKVTGVLESVVQASIIPETTGTVKKVYVREGDSVTKGQLLAQLINANIEASYQRSEIDLARAKREYDKATRLHQQGAISDLELQEAQTVLDTSETANKEALATAQTTAVRSPVTGVIATVNIREGEVVSASQIFQVVNLTQLRLIASVPERDLTLLKEEQPVVISAAYDNEATVNGFIERIAPVVDPNSGSVKVFINLEPKQQTLRPGQFVNASIEIDRHNDVLVVNKAAIVYDDGIPVAYVVEDAPEDEPVEKVNSETDKTEEDNQPKKEKAPYVAQRRELTLGYSDSSIAEVTEGLSLGEIIVVAGNTNLEDNSPIKLEISAAQLKEPEKDPSEEEK